ncbi:MAG: hypothetical protein IT293_19695 [Deltaproteobacteria bacterium]|nr:hypothetical protein [Deltaproteobacteria bacterium]
MKLAPFAAIALGALIAAPLVHAADQTILGSGFQAKNPASPDKRKVQVKAKEKGSPNTIVGNPAVNGATLTISANGTTPSQQVFNLPQGTNAAGKPFWSGDAVKGFKYSDSKGEQSPVKKVQLKAKNGVFSLQAQASGKIQPLNVTPPNIGSDACALLAIGGGGDSYSVKFAAGDGTIINKTTKEYSHKKVATEGTCVPTPTCSDGIQNQGESDVDCGGLNCPACPPGDSCVTHTDCTSGVCSSGLCQAPTCSDGVQNQGETGVDCGGPCSGCGIGGSCVANGDCQSGFCTGGLCKCPNQAYTFTVNSNVGGPFDSAEWPGGTANQSAVPGCSVTINRPNNNIDLTCSLAAPFSINAFSGYSNCFGNGGEDGDGCQPVSCPPLGIGSCCNTRPSCSAALNGSGSAQYFVQCLQ